MNYKGYEIRRVKTKLFKNGEVIEIEAWGIYANGDFKGSVKTPEQARDYIDGLMRGTLYRPKETTHIVQRTDYHEFGKVKTKVWRDDGIRQNADSYGTNAGNGV